MVCPLEKCWPVLLIVFSFTIAYKKYLETLYKVANKIWFTIMAFHYWKVILELENNLCASYLLQKWLNWFSKFLAIHSWIRPWVTVATKPWWALFKFIYCWHMYLKNKRTQTSILSLIVNSISYSRGNVREAKGQLLDQLLSYHFQLLAVWVTHSMFISLSHPDW